MLPPLDTVTREQWHFYHVVLSGLGAIGGWEGIKATLRGASNKVINAMPPLPENATWRERWLYAIAKAFASKEVVAASLGAKP